MTDYRNISLTVSAEVFEEIPLNVQCQFSLLLQHLTPLWTCIKMPYIIASNIASFPGFPILYEA